jgi:dienelactone hydrolase
MPLYKIAGFDVDKIKMLFIRLFILTGIFSVNVQLLQAQQSVQPLPFAAQPLSDSGDLTPAMVNALDHFLTDFTGKATQGRDQFWKRDFSDSRAFGQSIAGKRQLLLNRLGAEDKRVSPAMEIMTGPDLKPFTIQKQECSISAVRWNVLEGLQAEGILVTPKGRPVAFIVLIPDADMDPEQFAGLLPGSGAGAESARKLAELGCSVLIPVLVSRDTKFSGNPSLKLSTTQTHREWIYRQGYEVGRHVIGYELQKIFAAIDWASARYSSQGTQLPIGVAGYGEGGLLALYASALDTRISSTIVSGYFNQRQELWKEPIYRNVFGLLKYYSDAELAVMSWPRRLIIEQSNAPDAQPPASVKGSSPASPGSLRTPDYASAKSEWERVKKMLPEDHTDLFWIADAGKTMKDFFSAASLNLLVKELKINRPLDAKRSAPLVQPASWVNSSERQERTVRQMQDDIQRVLILSERTRNKNVWQQLRGDTVKQEPVKEQLREKFWAHLGRMDAPSIALNPRARVLERTAKWTSYQVKLDVWPGVFVWGILLIPNDLKANEKRPVVVCQHGLESDPFDVISTDPKSKFYHFYKGFAATLADRGYITFAPANLYKGEDQFRVLQRKTNPLELSLFSLIIGQHQAMVNWLRQLDFVDAGKIGFYGLSYGGKTAMRVPAVIKEYNLSICSGDFNEWVRKVATTDYPFSYMYTEEYDMMEWDLAHTFNYAEMAALIAPRPFMVERGHNDGVATDEWVGYEYEKVRRYYDALGLPERTRIEYFPGPHSINGIGTFQFLDKFLRPDLK